jgi:hypothetical protein
VRPARLPGARNERLAMRSEFRYTAAAIGDTPKKQISNQFRRRALAREDLQ